MSRWLMTAVARRKKMLRKEAAMLRTFYIDHAWKKARREGAAYRFAGKVGRLLYVGPLIVRLPL